jgi:hypothetical protein
MLLAEALDGMGKTEDAIKELEAATSKREIMRRRCRGCRWRSRIIRATPGIPASGRYRAAHK